jgi:hypothetical protein
MNNQTLHNNRYQRRITPGIPYGKSKAIITYGWVVEMKYPMQLCAFLEKKQTWGLNFFRNKTIPRQNTLGTIDSKLGAHTTNQVLGKE